MNCGNLNEKAFGTLPFTYPCSLEGFQKDLVFKTYPQCHFICHSKIYSWASDHPLVDIVTEGLMEMLINCAAIYLSGMATHIFQSPEIHGFPSSAF